MQLMPSEHKKYIKIFWMIYCIPVILLLLIIIASTLGIFGFMPSFVELENPKSNLASEVYSSDQVMIGKYYIENRSNLHYEDLSPNVVNALISTEDERFYAHSGVDIMSLIRVAVKNIMGGDRGAGGGSTVTQQLAKNLFPREQNLNLIEMGLRKIKEWIISVKLERNYTKEEILAMYLNTVDFGSLSFGIQSASKTFFGKTPKDLKVEEAAVLIGLLKAPTWYNPVRNYERSFKRRNVVLGQMLKNNCITDAQFKKLSKQKIDLSKYHIQDQNAGIATYLREYLRLRLVEWCKTKMKPDGTPYDLYKDGLRIYTTINSKMQKYAEEAVTEHLKKDLQPQFYKHWKGWKNAPFDTSITKRESETLMLSAMKRSDRYIRMKSSGVAHEKIREVFEKPVKMRIFSWNGEKDTIMSPWDSIRYYKFFLNAGFMAMEPQTGFVKAYVGGINYKYFKYDHVKIAKRQVGSTFKPILYALAMQEGEFTPCTKVPNTPVSFDMSDDEIWTPKNSSDAKEGEMVTLKWALANSINYVSAYLMKRYSPRAVVKLAKKMGITSDIPAVYSICLGTPDISLYEMVGANNVFVNKGIYIEPIFITRIEDNNGNVIESFVPKKVEAMNERTAFLMVELMKGVVQYGTSARLSSTYKLTNPMAGKTGTTQLNSDGWFIGLTPHLVSGVWVGAEDRSVHFRTITLGQGANMALPIWGIFMQKVYADKDLNVPKDDFDRPKSKVDVIFDCEKYERLHQNEDKFQNEGFD